MVRVLLGDRTFLVLRWDPAVRTVRALLEFRVHPENNILLEAMWAEIVSSGFFFKFYILIRLHKLMFSLLWHGLTLSPGTPGSPFGPEAPGSPVFPFSPGAPGVPGSPCDDK